MAALPLVRTFEAWQMTPTRAARTSNPFRGTPFEQLFNALNGGGLGGAMGAGGQMPDLTQIFGQLQSLMKPYDGPLNWEVALDLARKTVAQSPDPTPTAGAAGPGRPTRSGSPTTGSTRPRASRPA